jgi:hypothetical protein
MGEDLELNQFTGRSLDLSAFDFTADISDLFQAEFAAVAGVLGWELRGRRLDRPDDRVESR